MPTTKQLTAYARVLLQKRLNLQQGQTLVINAPVESHDFVTLLTKEAYTAGAAQVVCNWRSDAMARLRYEHEDQQYFESLPDWRRDFSLYYYHKKGLLWSEAVRDWSNPKGTVSVETGELVRSRGLS